MLQITDVTKTPTQVGIDTQDITAGSTVTGAELDRGADTAVEGVTALLTVTSYAAAPNATGYMRIALMPLDATGGTLFDDGIGVAVVPMNVNQRYDCAVQLTWPAGVRYLKVVLKNNTGQTANDVSVALRWQAVTV